MRKGVSGSFVVLVLAIIALLLGVGTLGGVLTLRSLEETLSGTVH